MLIALDYDHTYTRDPDFWGGFLAMAKNKGHRVVCVTMRYPHETVSLPCEVIYTSRKAKKPYAEALSLRVDIWIDDSPHFIFMDAIEANLTIDAIPHELPSSSAPKLSVRDYLLRLVRRRARSLWFEAILIVFGTEHFIG